MPKSGHTGKQLHVWLKDPDWAMIQECLDESADSPEGPLTLTALFKGALAMYYEYHVLGYSHIHPDDPRRNV